MIFEKVLDLTSRVLSPSPCLSSRAPLAARVPRALWNGECSTVLSKYRTSLVDLSLLVRARVLSSRDQQPVALCTKIDQ